MFNLVEKRRWYFLLSALVIIPGLLVIIYSWVVTGAPFRLSIDFVGGSIYNLTFIGDVNEGQIRDVFAASADDNTVIQQLGQTDQFWLLKNPQTDTNDSGAVIEMLSNDFEISGLDGLLSVSYNEDSGYLLDFSSATIDSAAIHNAFAELMGETTSLEQVNVSSWSVRASFKESETERQALEDSLKALAPLDRGSFSLEAVSATVGREVATAAVGAVFAAAIVVTGFIVIAFRQVPNAFRYGVCAIMAMLHDVLVVMGVMSLLGLLLNWEVDALFLTAILTVVGFSVQDTIVMFDRIRENIPLRLGEPYETIVNRSLWETIHRSLATQLNAFFIMIALLLFGGETVRQFIFILFVGLVSGSYSSLFTAVPLLVSWEKGEIPFVNQGSKFQTEDDE
jgi:preprotein translocase SecF subunit